MIEIDEDDFGMIIDIFNQMYTTIEERQEVADGIKEGCDDIDTALRATVNECNNDSCENHDYIVEMERSKDYIEGQCEKIDTLSSELNDMQEILRKYDVHNVETFMGDMDRRRTYVEQKDIICQVCGGPADDKYSDRKEGTIDYWSKGFCSRPCLMTYRHHHHRQLTHIDDHEICHICRGIDVRKILSPNQGLIRRMVLGYTKEYLIPGGFPYWVNALKPEDRSSFHTWMLDMIVRVGESVQGSIKEYYIRPDITCMGRRQTMHAMCYFDRKLELWEKIRLLRAGIRILEEDDMNNRWYYNIRDSSPGIPPCIRTVEKARRNNCGCGGDAHDPHGKHDRWSVLY